MSENIVISEEMKEKIEQEIEGLIKESIRKPLYLSVQQHVERLIIYMPIERIIQLSIDQPKIFRPEILASVIETTIADKRKLLQNKENEQKECIVDIKICENKIKTLQAALLKENKPEKREHLNNKIQRLEIDTIIDKICYNASNTCENDIKILEKAQIQVSKLVAKEQEEEKTRRKKEQEEELNIEQQQTVISITPHQPTIQEQQQQTVISITPHQPTIQEQQQPTNSIHPLISIIQIDTIPQQPTIDKQTLKKRVKKRVKKQPQKSTKQGDFIYGGAEKAMQNTQSNTLGGK